MTSQALPAGTTLLLRGGRVLTPDADWHDPPQADVAVAGDRIAGVAPGYQLAEAGGVEVIDARDHLVLPGFVNAHYHSHDVLAKGTLEEVPLETCGSTRCRRNIRRARARRSTPAPCSAPSNACARA